MALQFNPYITFDGNAAQAMDYYASILGGTPQVLTFRESGMDVDGVMHAALATPDDFHIFASDHAEGMGEYRPGTNMQLSLSGDENERLRGFFEALARDGQVVVPMEKQMWGDEYGQLVDKFGIVWHVNLATEPA